MPMTALILAGTGYPAGGDGVCETFAAHLDERFLPQIVRYPADFGGQMSWAESRAAGRQALIDAIRGTSNRVVLAGFSQGAGIAGDLAAEIGRGDLPDLEVVGCALIADPSRPPGVGMPGSPVIGGYGIVGARPIPTIPTWWAAAEGDPITALPAGNPLRTLADAADYYSLAGPAEAFQWGEHLVDRAKAGQWQRWWSLENWRSWGGAVAYARGYLFDGRHGHAYVAEGICRNLADVVNREVS